MRKLLRIIMTLVVCGVAACNEHPIPQPAKSQVLDIASGVVNSGDISSEAEVVSPQSQTVVSYEVAAFINALKADDPAVIRAYFPANYPAVELMPDAPDMLFIRDELKPLIANGNVDAKEVSREGHTFSILFYRKPFANRLNDKTYLESDYLKTFFVCNFDDTSGRWILSHPIMCYDETEGPYERVGY